MDILQEIQEIMRDIFDDENLIITGECNSDNIDDWDSLSHINIMVQIQKKFEIRFTVEEIANTKNVAKIVELVQNKLK